MKNGRWIVPHTTFLQTWGYWAVLLGAMIEGESVILTASAAASAGYLSIYKVALVTFLGTLFADQGLYLVGFYWGQNVLDRIKKKFPKTGPYMEKGFSLLEKYRTAYILIFRFIYGVRIISPVLIGSRRIPFSTFSFLNFIAAIIWTIISCSLGYFFGGIILNIIQRVGYILFFIFVSIVGTAGVLWWWHRRKKRIDRGEMHRNMEKDIEEGFDEKR